MRRDHFFRTGAFSIQHMGVACLCAIATLASAQMAPTPPATVINRNPERRIGIEAEAQQAPAADPRDSTSRPVESPVKAAPDLRDTPAEPVKRQDALRPPGTAASGPSYALPRP